MSLFGKNKTEEKKVVAVKPTSAKAMAGKPVTKKASPKPAVKKTPSKSVATLTSRHLSAEPAKVIIHPHITEKSGVLSQKSIYTFEVRSDAGSQEITEAIEVLYKVVPVRISVVPIRSKARNYRGIPGGRSAGGKKAYVYLKKGDTIEFI